MARAKKKQEEMFVNSLLDAMKFLSFAQNSSGNDWQKHCILSNHTAIATNGVISAGQYIDEDLEACPQTDMMELALASCGQHFSVVQLPDNKLQVRSGEFLALVPCCERTRLPSTVPDALVAPLDESFVKALKIVLPLVNEKAKTVVQASILVKAGSLIGTNKIVIVEAWHGHDLPNGFVMPKAAATALIKCGKKLTGFGFSGASATFWFEDHSWIKTQLYQEKWPDLPAFFDAATNPRKVPEGLFAAIKQVAPFSEYGRVVCAGKDVKTEGENQNAQNVIIDEAMLPRIYTAKDMAIVAKLAETIDESGRDATLFFAPNLRGAIAHYVYDPMPLPTCGDPKCNGACSVCIPF